MVENQDVAFCLDNVGEVGIWIRQCFKQHTLVIDPWFLVVKHLTGHCLKQHLVHPGEFDDLVDAFVWLERLGNPKSRRIASPRSQGFKNSIPPIQQLALDQERRRPLPALGETARTSFRAPVALTLPWRTLTVSWRARFGRTLTWRALVLIVNWAFCSRATTGSGSIAAG